VWFDNGASVAACSLMRLSGSAGVLPLSISRMFCFVLVMAEAE
jgi:hypothetical protein